MANKIVNKEEFKKHVSKYNKVLAKDFLMEKKAEGKAEGTIHQYKCDLRIMLYYVWKYFDNKNLTDLTRKDIRNMIMIIKDTGVSNARINRQVSCLRSCLEYALDDDDYEYDNNISKRVKGMPRKPVREKTFLSEAQVKVLKNWLLNEGEILKAIYLLLSYHSGARKNEVYQVKKYGLTKHLVTNKVVGKGGKVFRLYYGKETQQLIKKYLKQRGKDSISNLFVKTRKNGEKVVLTSGTFNGWTTQFSRYLSEYEGREIHIYPHAFRNSRADNLDRQGVPLNKIRKLLNHNDLSTTQGYLSDREEEDIASIFGVDIEELYR